MNQSREAALTASRLCLCRGFAESGADRQSTLTPRSPTVRLADGNNDARAVSFHTHRRASTRSRERGPACIVQATWPSATPGLAEAGPSHTHFPKHGLRREIAKFLMIKTLARRAPLPPGHPARPYPGPRAIHKSPYPRECRGYANAKSPQIEALHGVCRK